MLELGKDKLSAETVLLSALQEEPSCNKIDQTAPEDEVIADLALHQNEVFHDFVFDPVDELLNTAVQWAQAEFDEQYMKWWVNKYPRTLVPGEACKEPISAAIMVARLWYSKTHDNALQRIEAATKSKELKSLINRVRLLPRYETVSYKLDQ
jgi:hypothetical protein